jgi:hypothetical protein
MAKIPDVPLDAWKNLYAAATKFRAREPWDHFEDSMVFGVHDPVAGQMGYACVLGALGEILALCVYRGAEGFDIHRRIQKNEFHRRPDELVAMQNCLMAEFADGGELEKVDRAVIGELGLKFRGLKSWPMFRSHLPGYAPWHLSASEAAYLASALRCACDAASKVIERKLKLEEKPGQVFCYFPTGDLSKPGFETRWEPEPIYRPQPPAPFMPDAGKIAQIKSRSPKADSAWEADVFCLPAPIGDRDRPYLARCALVAHQASGFIIQSGIATPELASEQALGEGLLVAIEKAGRLPGEIHLRDGKLAACLAPLGKSLGIELKVGELKMVREAKKELEKFMRTPRGRELR